MISSVARAWPAMSPGCRDRPSGPASVVPATQQQSPTPAPGCSRHAPPTARPTRCGAARSRPGSRRRRRPARPATRGRPGRARSRAATRRRSAVRGTIDSTSRYSVGAWSLPPTGPRPSRLGTPMPDVVFASDAPPVAVSAIVNPRPSATALACSTSRALRGSFSIGHQRAIGSNSTSTSGTTVASASWRISASAASSSTRVTPRTSTSSEQCSATTLGRVPPRMTPTFTVTPGHRPLSACRSLDDASRLEDRAPALLGLHAGMRGSPCDR